MFRCGSYTNRKMNQQVSFLDFFKYNEELWFVDYNSMSLCNINLENQYVNYVVDLPQTELCENYRAIYIVNGKVYLPPLFAEQLLIYDIEKRQLKQVSLDKYRISGMKANYVDIFKGNDCLYCLPTSDIGILQIDTETDEVVVYDDLPRQILDEENRERPVFRKGCLYEGKIYLGLCNRTSMIVFDICTGKYQYIMIPDKLNDGYSSCCCAEKKIILLSYSNNDVVVIDKDDRSISHVSLKGMGKFSALFANSREAIHIRCAGSESMDIIDLYNLKITSVTLNLGRMKDEEMSKLFPDNSFALMTKKLDDSIWIYATAYSAIFVIDIGGNIIREIKIQTNDYVRNQLQQIKTKRMCKRLQSDKEVIINEQGICTLDWFIDGIIRMDKE